MMRTQSDRRCFARRHACDTWRFGRPLIWPPPPPVTGSAHKPLAPASERARKLLKYLVPSHWLALSLTRRRNLWKWRARLLKSVIARAVRTARGAAGRTEFSLIIYSSLPPLSGNWFLTRPQKDADGAHQEVRTVFFICALALKCLTLWICSFSLDTRNFKMRSSHLSWKWLFLE